MKHIHVWMPLLLAIGFLGSLLWFLNHTIKEERRLDLESRRTTVAKVVGIGTCTKSGYCSCVLVKDGKDFYAEVLNPMVGMEVFRARHYSHTYYPIYMFNE
jgi:hypothetical protein